MLAGRAAFELPSGRRMLLEVKSRSGAGALRSSGRMMCRACSASLEPPIHDVLLCSRPSAPTARVAAPMPAPVEDLAGGPTTKPVMPEPKEPNLFDLYGDEDEAAPAEEAPGEDAPADAPSATADDGAVEPAEDAAAEAAPAEEAEMAEEESEDAQSEAPESADSDGSETAEEPAPSEEPAE